MSTTVDDETILEVLRSNDAPRMTTTEVAGHLPVTRGTTRSRLQRLVDDDLLERKREGNNVVWWLPERADELAEWEAEQAAEEEEPTDAEAEAEDATEEAEPADEDAEAAEEAPAESSVDDTDADDDTAVEVEATEQANAETEETDTSVEVEAVEDEGIDEVSVTTPDEETESRTAADRSELSEDVRETAEPSPAAHQKAELSEDEEGIRALALLAAAIVVFILFRKLLSGGEETE